MRAEIYVPASWPRRPGGQKKAKTESASRGTPPPPPPPPLQQEALPVPPLQPPPLFAELPPQARPLRTLSAAQLAHTADAAPSVFVQSANLPSAQQPAALAEREAPVPRAPPAPKRSNPEAGPSEWAQRKELRAAVANQCSLQDLLAYSASPPGERVADEQLAPSELCLRLAARGLRLLEPPGPLSSAGDLELLLRHMCCVPSQRSRSVGRLCSNAPVCNNHTDEAREAHRRTVLNL